MSENSKPLIIMTICIIAAIGIFSAVSYYKYQNVPEVDVSESPFDIIWGTSLAEVETLMSDKGYVKYVQDEESGQRPVYTITDYQGIEGLSGQAILLFDESVKYNEVILHFQSIENSNGMCEVEVMDSYYKSLKKSLNKYYEKVSYDALDGYEYWMSKEAFITVIYKKSDSLTIDFANANTVAEYSEEIKK